MGYDIGLDIRTENFENDSVSASSIFLSNLVVNFAMKMNNASSPLN